MLVHYTRNSLEVTCTKAQGWGTHEASVLRSRSARNMRPNTSYGTLECKGGGQNFGGYHYSISIHNLGIFEYPILSLIFSKRKATSLQCNWNRSAKTIVRYNPLNCHKLERNVVLGIRERPVSGNGLLHATACRHAMMDSIVFDHP